jgi:hypothetical protein
MRDLIGKANSMRSAGHVEFSVLIPWCNRDELAVTLRDNAAWLRLHSCEVLVINCGGEPKALKQHLAKAEVQPLRYVEIPRHRFNKALGLNIGIYLSRGHYIFVLDADISLQSDLLGEVRDTLTASTFVTVASVYESHPQPTFVSSQLGPSFVSGFITSIVHTASIELSFTDGTSIRHRTSSRNARDGSRAGPGLLIARRKDLVEIDGYNSELEHWGWEDDDVQVRLQKKLGLHHIEIGKALHLSHGDDRRALFGEARGRADVMNFARCCERYSHGDFSGTYADDVASWKEKIKVLDRGST